MRTYLPLVGIVGSVGNVIGGRSVDGGCCGAVVGEDGGGLLGAVVVVVVGADRAVVGVVAFRTVVVVVATPGSRCALSSACLPSSTRIC